MAAAAVLHGNGVDIIFTGADLAQYAPVTLCKVYPNIHAFNVCHGVDHAPGHSEGVGVQCVKLIYGGVNVGHIFSGKLDLQNEFGL